MKKKIKQKLEQLDCELFYQMQDGEECENRAHHDAIVFFNEIITEFPHDEFTFEDIKKSYYRPINKVLTKFFSHKQEYLDDLLRLNLVNFDEEQNTYSVNYSNPDVDAYIEIFEKTFD